MSVGTGVRGAWLRAPWWVLALTLGAIFAVGQLAVRLLQGESVAASALPAALSGVFFGLIMGAFTRQMNRRWLAAVADLPASEHREVRRAARRGPAPADPEVRRAALEIVAHQITVFRALRWAVLMYGALAVMTAFLVLVASPWWILSVLFWLGLLALHLWMPRHLRDRQRLLSEPTPASV